jgi:hypothetical protein
MKHILKERMIISESEKSRILGIHDKYRKTMGGFLHEQNMDEATKFFADQKTKFNNFPDGKVVPYGNTFGYEVVNTDGTKYILLPNGSSLTDNGTGYKESTGYSWTKTPYVAAPTGTATTSTTPTGTATTSTTPTGTATTSTTPTGTATTSTTPTGTVPTDLESNKELRQGYRQRKRDAAELKKERENKIKEIQNDIDKRSKTYNNGNNPNMTAQQKTNFKNYIDAKKIELEKLKNTPIGSEPTNTKPNTVNPSVTRSKEDQAAIDAGAGL